MFEYGLYVPGDTLMHRLDVRIKVLWFISTLIASVVIQWDGRISFFIWAGLVASLIVAKVPKGRLIFWGTASIAFLIVCLILYPPMYKGEVFLTVPILGWEYTDIGLMVAFGKYFVIVNPITVFLIIFCTTLPSEMLFLVQSVGVSYRKGSILPLGLKFLPVAFRETKSVMDSQMSRGLELQGRNILKRIRNFIPIFTPLMIRMLDGMVKLGTSMESKCFGAKKKRTFIQEFKIRQADVLFLIAINCFFILLIYLSFEISPVRWGM